MPCPTLLVPMFSTWGMMACHARRQLIVCVVQSYAAWNACCRPTFYPGP